MKISRRHVAWVGVAALLVVSVVLALWAARWVVEGAAWRDHTFQVLIAADDLLSDLKDAETGQRGYLLTGDERYLAPYVNVAGAIDGELAALRRLTADSPAQQQRLDALQPLVAERLTILARTIVLHQQGNGEAALAIIKQGRSKALMDSARRIMAAFTDEERGLLRLRSERMASSMRYLVLGVIVAAVLAVLVAGGAAYRILRLGEETRRKAAFQDTLLDSADAAIVSTTPEGVITSFNRGAEQLFGHRAEELVGKHTPAAFYDADEIAARAAELSRELGRRIEPGFEVFMALPALGKQDTREWTCRRRDGVRVSVLLSVSAMRDDQGRLIGLLGIARDITDRKQAAQALIVARDAAEQASRAKDSFLATMSHEIRTPLGGLLGMLELLGYTPLSEDQRETLLAARESGRSLLRIVNDILDWSKIEAGKLEIAPQATSLAQLLTGVVTTYARVASANSLLLEQQVDARLSPVHTVDPLRLSQVLNNFVSNALKFTHQGGVEVRAELLSRGDGCERVRFSVKDTGIGIEQAVQRCLFRSFSQGSADTARMYGGTGLGLAICRRLADLMDGRLELESAPGRGSTFSITLTLPLSDAAAEPVPRALALADTLPVQAANTTQGVAPADAAPVLVVDDHPTNRKLLAIQLGLLGLPSTLTENGETALAAWRDGRYSLIITDCHMPVMDGYALAQAIRRSEADQALLRTPILGWTANALAAEADRCRAAGMDDLLVKPVDLAQLKEVVAKWLPVAAVGPQAAPVALAALDQLSMNAVDKEEILQDFMTQTRSDLADLQAALTVPNFPASARIAHRMKGASQMVGAYELAAVCETIESVARQGDNGETDAENTALLRLAAHLVDAIGLKEHT